MAGFLPQVDRLQKLLANDFDKQFELAKAVKSKQVAETYMPLIANSKTTDEAVKMHQMALTEAGRYGLNSLTPVLNESFSSKKYQITENEKDMTAKAKFNTLLGSYANVNMFNNFRGQNTSGAEFLNDWIKYNTSQGVDPLLAITQAEDAIKNNLFEEKTTAGTFGDNVIVITKQGTNKFGKQVNGKSLITKYDYKNNLLYFDENNDNQAQENEIAPLELMNESSVQEQIKGIQGREEGKVSRALQERSIANSEWGNALQAQDISFRQNLASKAEITPVAGKTSIVNGLQKLQSSTYLGGTTKTQQSALKLLNPNAGNQYSDLARKYGITEEDYKKLQEFNPTNITDKTTGEYSSILVSYYPLLQKVRNFFIEFASSKDKGLYSKEINILTEDLDYYTRFYEASLHAGKGMQTNIMQPVTAQGMQWNKSNSEIYLQTAKGKSIQSLQETGYDLSGTEVRWTGGFTPNNRK